MSMVGPLPDTPQTYLKMTLDHVESARWSAERLGAHVWSLLARINALEAEVQGLRAYLAPDQQAAHLEHTQLRAEIARLHEALAFAASAIKSGESWSATCEEMIGGALRREP